MGASRDFSQIAAGGFNVIHQFRAIQDSETAITYLSQAEAEGLNVIQNLPLCRAYFDPLWCTDPAVEVWSESEWGSFISALSVHDNLVAWFLPDEITDYQVANNLYQWVKTYDPRQRPVYGNPGSFDLTKMTLFSTFFSDFLWLACYPEYYEEPRAIVTYGMSRGITVTAQTGDRLGAILQFFDSADDGGSGYPTAHELRADSYQAIITGAKGLWYYNYGSGKDLPGLLAGIEQVADEIIGQGNLDEVILSADVPQTITKTVISGPTQSPVVRGEVYDSIQTLQKEYQEAYLLAVNIATDTVVVRFNNLPPAAYVVEVLFEDRRIPIRNGAFEDTFEENDTYIYRLISNCVYLPMLVRQVKPSN